MAAEGAIPSTPAVWATTLSARASRVADGRSSVRDMRTRYRPSRPRADGTVRRVTVQLAVSANEC